MPTKTPTQRVAGTIRAELARQKKKHAGLAAALGITRSSMHRRLTGEQAMNLDELHLVAAYLGIPVSALLGEDVAA